MAYGIRIWDGGTPQNIIMDISDDTMFETYANTITLGGGISWDISVSDLTTVNGVRNAMPSDSEGGAKIAWKNNYEMTVTNNKSTSETITVVVWARGDG